MTSIQAIKWYGQLTRVGSRGFGKKEKRHLPFTKQQFQHWLLISVKTTKKDILFSFLLLKRQSIYILSQIAQVVRWSEEQLVDTLVQCDDCADLHNYEHDGKLA